MCIQINGEQVLASWQRHGYLSLITVAVIMLLPLLLIVMSAHGFGIIEYLEYVRI